MVWDLTKENISNAGGPQHNQSTYTIWVKHFSKKKLAKKYAAKDYPHIRDWASWKPSYDKSYEYLDTGGIYGYTLRKARIDE